MTPTPPPSPAASPVVTFTADQQRAIAASGHGILVSAAAGSGKTATLTQRVITHIATQGATVDQFLILTFTENAANEMRSRIERSLQSAARGSASTHLATQASLASRLAISTIHSFCTRLIRQHFHLLGVDPAFKVLDEQSAGLLRRDSLQAALASAYATTDTPALNGFTDLLHIFSDDEETAAGQLVLRLDKLLASLPDRDRWCTDAIARLKEAVDQPTTCRLRTDLLRLAHQRLDDFDARADRIIRLSHVAPKLADYTRIHVVPLLARWRTELDAPAAPDLLWTVSPFPDLPNAPPTPEADLLAQSAKLLLRDLKRDIGTGPIPSGLVALADVKLWVASLQSVLPAMEALVEITRRFAVHYADVKRRIASLDFADLEQFALRLLQRSDGTPTPLARELVRHHPHVLIDECQDINPVQDRLIALISGEAEYGPAGSHLFSVGDLKQSIYRFRLAAPELFQRRQRIYEAAALGDGVIRLAENFRSRPALIEALNQLFCRLMVGGRTEIDYTAGHELAPGGTPAPAATFTGCPLEVHLLPRAPSHAKPSANAADEREARDDEDTDSPDDDLDRFEVEADFIALRIRQLVGRSPNPDGTRVAAAVADPAAPGGTRPMRFGDIAILLRAATVKSAQVAAMLRRRGVPVRAEARGGLLAAQEVQDLLATLSLLENPADEPALLTFLRSPLARLEGPDTHLARARLHLPDGSLSAAIHAYARLPEGTALADALARLEPWRRLAARQPVADVLARICSDTHYPDYVLGLPDGALARASIIELGQLADQFTAALGHGAPGGPTTAAFVRYMRAANEEAELGQPTPPALSDDNVTVLTIHKAKGLEFPIVIVPDLGKRFNTRDLTEAVLIGRDEGLAPKAADLSLKLLYPSPAWACARELCRPKLLAEELRVLYVALTRAREHVLLIGTAKPGTWATRQRTAAGLCSHPRLPEPIVLTQSCALDWLLLAGAHAEATGHPVLQVREWSQEQLDLLAQSSGIEARPRVPAEVLALQPLVNAPAPTPEIGAAIVALRDRLTATYPHSAAVGRHAAISVTSTTHPHSPTPAPNASPLSPAESPSPQPSSPPLSRALTGQSAPLAATERGTATHIALEHYDFRLDPTDDVIEAHLDDLRRRHLLTDLEVGAVEQGAFRFLAESELGPFLRGERGTLHPELPIYLPGDEGHGLDRQMIRGRIDLLVDTPDGPVIIDFKTDHVWGERLHQRILQYKGQVELYRRAAQAITGRPAAGVYLAFVHAQARRIVRFTATDQ